MTTIATTDFPSLYSETTDQACLSGGPTAALPRSCNLPIAFQYLRFITHPRFMHYTNTILVGQADWLANSRHITKSLRIYPDDADVDRNSSDGVETSLIQPDQALLPKCSLYTVQKSPVDRLFSVHHLPFPLNSTLQPL
jgi:hypothetical protein